MKVTLTTRHLPRLWSKKSHVFPEHYYDFYVGQCHHSSSPNNDVHSPGQYWYSARYYPHYLAARTRMMIDHPLATINNRGGFSRSFKLVWAFVLSTKPLLGELSAVTCVLVGLFVYMFVCMSAFFEKT